MRQSATPFNVWKPPDPSSSATEKPSLIILDIQLPDMDGYAIARELKANPTFAHIPMVAVTSYAMVGDRARSLAAGCEGYIEKPINPDTFVAQIEKHLPCGSSGSKGES
jgi:two-component system, cell cycle response regulator DivK